MTIKIRRIDALPILKTASNRTLPRIILVTPSKRTATAIPKISLAQPHDETTFADMDSGGHDASTFETSQGSVTNKSITKTTPNTSLSSQYAVKIAETKGYITTTQNKNNLDNEQMPFGFCAEKDKKFLKEFLLSLKKNHS